MVSAEIIAQRLRSLRGEQSQEEAAKALDISLSALSTYENGLRIPRDEIKLAFARYYNTSIEALFFEV